MTIERKQKPLFQQRDALQATQPGGWRSQFQGNVLIANLIRVGFLAMVLSVLAGVWIVSSAHLTEQFRGAPQQTAGLIDPDAGKGALTPDNIEDQILAFNLRLRENELYVPVSDNPQQRPFVVNLGEPARFIAARLEAEGEGLLQARVRALHAEARPQRHRIPRPALERTGRRRQIVRRGAVPATERAIDQVHGVVMADVAGYRHDHVGRPIGGTPEAADVVVGQ